MMQIDKKPLVLKGQFLKELKLHTGKYAISFCSQGKDVLITRLEEKINLPDLMAQENRIENLPEISTTDYYIKRIFAVPKKRSCLYAPGILGIIFFILIIEIFNQICYGFIIFRMSVSHFLKREIESDKSCYVNVESPKTLDNSSFQFCPISTVIILLKIKHYRFQMGLLGFLTLNIKPIMGKNYYFENNIILTSEKFRGVLVNSLSKILQSLNLEKKVRERDETLEKYLSSKEKIK